MARQLVRLSRNVEYKAEWHGRTLVAVDRWFPSSKLCSTALHGPVGVFPLGNLG
ncbi:zinc ribbon domain-containing protein [Dactylosporangium sp. NPDC050588]|uniref:zinc ribbon domain-containing protein n=1 Tax=Dactylosporangium sp. NPDC050588 TaxID=3157211 RepID=UPI0033F077EA